MRMIPNDFWNQNFFTVFRFRGIPVGVKNFIFEIRNFKKFSRAQFSIFFDGTGLKWKISKFRTYVQSRFCRFCPRGSCGVPKVTQVGLFWYSGPHTDPRGAKSAESALYVCAKFWYLSFKTGPVKKYWELRPWELFEILNFENNFFYTNGDSPKTENGKKNWFQKSLVIVLMVILSYYRGNLGVKSRHGVT